MKCRLYLMFPVLLAVASSSKAAGDPSAPLPVLHWRCWYDQKVHITCLLVSWPKADGFPVQFLPSNLPEIVKVLRSNPGAFRNQFVHIPLFSEPMEESFAFQLARSAVCGSRLDCIVSYSHQPPSPAELSNLLNRSSPGQAEDPVPQVAVPEK